MRLEPADEGMHPAGSEPDFNESMYFNLFDPERGVGGFFRLGNRPNEGHAEMTVCVFLPEGRAAFMYGRPEIAGNEAFDAGGLSFEVGEPFRRQRVAYSGPVLELDDPLLLSDPRRAFGEAPRLEAHAEIDFEAAGPAFGGEPDPGEEAAPAGLADAFARGHYEQHVSGSGTLRIGEREWQLAGHGLRDHSWGPRSWQAPAWYRWLNATAAEGEGFMIAVVAGRDGSETRSGVLLAGGEQEPILDAALETDPAARFGGAQGTIRCRARTAGREVLIEGEVRSLVPLRNRREGAVTTIGEGLTAYRWDGHEAWGISEYLDQR